MHTSPTPISCFTSPTHKLVQAYRYVQTSAPHPSLFAHNCRNLLQVKMFNIFLFSVQYFMCMVLRIKPVLQSVLSCGLSSTSFPNGHASHTSHDPAQSEGFRFTGPKSLLV
ncbi:hypothetical protein KIL84_006694 [Mauremys mutica]|uniref:Uncharacterized protein n=1 Tax=Mauremys mutica TaxID=74926 RepID=A0A9D4AWA2_9SAUR|nr:hypothetical protein KIL84_006694 [Mauremys mutica]